MLDTFYYSFLSIMKVSYLYQIYKNVIMIKSKLYPVERFKHVILQFLTFTVVVLKINKMFELNHSSHLQKKLKIVLI